MAILPYKKLLARIKEIEAEAQIFEKNHKYDTQNNAKLELAHEMHYLLTEGGMKDRLLDEVREEALEACVQSAHDAFNQAMYEIREELSQD